MTESRAYSNPYVGPRTFEEREADRFFGREREARELVALVVNERLTLFYAQSGAGKSSLINARLIPRLRDEESFAVLPVGRVSGVLPDGIDATSISNIFVYHLILGLSQRLAEHEALSTGDTVAGPPDLRQTSLARFLSGESGPDPVTEAVSAGAGPPDTSSTDDLMPHVLIIDQFEELLTTYPERWQERAGFFEQLSTTMARHPNLWIVLTLREDYVASLEPYSHLAPNRLRARFYMQRMGIEAAREAIERPAALAGRPFAEGVAGRLVDNLRMVRTAGQEVYHAGEYVEPVQLQVVCFQLWQDLRARPAPTIELADLERLAGGGSLAEYVDRALSDFYERAIAKVVETGTVDVTERALRKWFADELITEAGTRSIVFRNETTGKTEGLPNRAVDLLAAQFLLRTELRAGGAWVELVHDRLVEPIRDSNDAWLKKNQTPLQRQAAIWRDEGKPPDRLLLAGPDLVETEEWAGEHEGELEPHEVEFLAASKAARDLVERQRAAEREAAGQLEVARQRQRADEQAAAADLLRQESQRTRTVATIAVVLALLAIIALGAAWNRQLATQTARATEEAAKSEALQALATANFAQVTEEAARHVALSAQQEAEVARATEEAAKNVARSTQLADLSVQQAEAFDRALLLGVEALRAADTEAARGAMTRVMSLWREVVGYYYMNQPPVSLAFSQAGDTLISGDDAGNLVAWSDLASARPISATFHTELGPAYAVAVSNDRKLVAGGFSGGSIRIWEQQPGRPPLELDGPTDDISNLAFSPDAQVLVSASRSGELLLWPLASAGDPIPLETRAGPVWALAFGPPGATIELASGGNLGQVTVWTDLDARPLSPDELELGETITQSVTSLAFDPAGTRLAIGFDDGKFTVWDVQRKLLLFDPIVAGEVSVSSLAFDLHDNTLVLLLADGVLSRYSLQYEAGSGPGYVSGTRPVADARSGALGPDGRRWAIGLNTGAIMLGRTAAQSSLDSSAGVEELIRQACRIANRNLSEPEWEQTVGAKTPYRQTCPETK